MKIWCGEIHVNKMHILSSEKPSDIPWTNLVLPSSLVQPKIFFCLVQLSKQINVRCVIFQIIVGYTDACIYSGLPPLHVNSV